MSTYAEFRPTCFDQHIAIEDREHWVIAPVGQNRDSNELDQSNFAAALELLGGESDTVEVHRFGHWAVGWFEILIVDQADAKRISILDDIARRLDDYPVLDESDWSRREYESFLESWESWGAREFRQECVKAFGLGNAAESRLDDIDDSTLLEFWMTNAPIAYESDSSGVVIRFDWVSRSTGMTRQQMAEVLRLSRN